MSLRNAFILCVNNPTGWKGQFWKKKKDLKDTHTHTHTHTPLITSVYRKKIKVVWPKWGCSMLTSTAASEYRTGADAASPNSDWIAASCRCITCRLSGVKTQSCVLRLQPVLTSVFVFCPRAGTHESGAPGSMAVTPATRTTPLHIIAAILLLQHTHARTHTHTHTHTELCPVLSPQDGSHGCFEEARNTATFGPMGAETVLPVWVMIDSMLDYSEALVMVNLLHVLVLYSAGVNRSVCRSGSLVWLCVDGKSVIFRKLDKEKHLNVLQLKEFISYDGKQSTSEANTHLWLTLGSKAVAMESSRSTHCL